MRVEVGSTRADWLPVSTLPLLRGHQPGLTNVVARRHQSLSGKRFRIRRLPLHLHPHLLLHVGQPLQVGRVNSPCPQVHLLHWKLLQYGQLSDLAEVILLQESDPGGRGFSLPQQSIWSDLGGKRGGPWGDPPPVCQAPQPGLPSINIPLKGLIKKAS